MLVDDNEKTEPGRKRIVLPFCIDLTLNLYSASQEGQHFEASSFIQYVFSELLLRSTFTLPPEVFKRNQNPFPLPYSHQSWFLSPEILRPWKEWTHFKGFLKHFSKNYTLRGHFTFLVATPTTFPWARPGSSKQEGRT